MFENTPHFGNFETHGREELRESNCDLMDAIIIECGATNSFKQDKKNTIVGVEYPGQMPGTMRKLEIKRKHIDAIEEALDPHYEVIFHDYVLTQGAYSTTQKNEFETSQYYFYDPAQFVQGRRLDRETGEDLEWALSRDDEVNLEIDFGMALNSLTSAREKQAA